MIENYYKTVIFRSGLYLIKIILIINAEKD
jgi:hypothetical protein